jgi:hypothetical protein
MTADTQIVTAVVVVVAAIAVTVVVVVVSVAAAVAAVVEVIVAAPVVVVPAVTVRRYVAVRCLAVPKPYFFLFCLCIVWFCGSPIFCDVPLFSLVDAYRCV